MKYVVTKKEYARAFETLGVPFEADEDTVKHAFRDIALYAHPDKSGNDPVLEATFKEANNAYEIIVNVRDHTFRILNEVESGSYEPPSPVKNTHDHEEKISPDQEAASLVDLVRREPFKLDKAMDRLAFLEKKYNLDFYSEKFSILSFIAYGLRESIVRVYQDNIWQLQFRKLIHLGIKYPEFKDIFNFIIKIVVQAKCEKIRKTAGKNSPQEIDFLVRILKHSEYARSLIMSVLHELIGEVFN